MTSLSTSESCNNVKETLFEVTLKYMHTVSGHTSDCHTQWLNRLNDLCLSERFGAKAVCLAWKTLLKVLYINYNSSRLIDDKNKEAKTVHNKRAKQVKAFERQLLIIYWECKCITNHSYRLPSCIPKKNVFIGIPQSNQEYILQ